MSTPVASRPDVIGRNENPPRLYKTINKEFEIMISKPEAATSLRPRLQSRPTALLPTRGNLLLPHTLASTIPPLYTYTTYCRYEGNVTKQARKETMLLSQDLRPSRKSVFPAAFETSPTKTAEFDIKHSGSSEFTTLFQHVVTYTMNMVDTGDLRSLARFRLTSVLGYRQRSGTDHGQRSRASTLDSRLRQSSHDRLRCLFHHQRYVEHTREP